MKIDKNIYLNPILALLSRFEFNNQDWQYSCIFWSDGVSPLRITSTVRFLAIFSIWPRRTRNYPKGLSHEIDLPFEEAFGAWIMEIYLSWFILLSLLQRTFKNSCITWLKTYYHGNKNRTPIHHGPVHSMGTVQKQTDRWTKNQKNWQVVSYQFADHMYSNDGFRLGYAS